MSGRLARWIHIQHDKKAFIRSGGQAYTIEYNGQGYIVCGPGVARTECEDAADAVAFIQGHTQALAAVVGASIFFNPPNCEVYTELT